MKLRKNIPGGRKLKKSRFKKKRNKYLKQIADIISQPLREAILKEDILSQIFTIEKVENNVIRH